MNDLELKECAEKVEEDESLNLERQEWGVTLNDGLDDDIFWVLPL